MTALGEEDTSDAKLVRTIAAHHAAAGSRTQECREAEAELCRRFAPRIRTRATAVELAEIS